eukprot:5913692-Prymnesium_polylepis.1
MSPPHRTALESCDRRRALVKVDVRLHPSAWVSQTPTQLGRRPQCPDRCRGGAARWRYRDQPARPRRCIRIGPGVARSRTPRCNSRAARGGHALAHRKRWP